MNEPQFNKPFRTINGFCTPYIIGSGQTILRCNEQFLYSWYCQVRSEDSALYRTVRVLPISSGPVRRSCAIANLCCIDRFLYSHNVRFTLKGIGRAFCGVATTASFCNTRSTILDIKGSGDVQKTQELTNLWSFTWDVLDLWLDGGKERRWSAWQGDLLLVTIGYAHAMLCESTLKFCVDAFSWLCSVRGLIPLQIWHKYLNKKSI